MKRSPVVFTMRVAAATFAVAVAGPSPAWAAAFTILDIQNEATVLLYRTGVSETIVSPSSAFVHLTDWTFPDEYDGTLPSPFYPYGEAFADGPSVSIDIAEHWDEGPIDARATSTITFAPTFDGYANEIQMSYGMSGWDVHTRWSITDLTTNSLVSLGAGQGSGGSEVLTYGVYGGTELYAWDSTHTYQLVLSAWGGGNRGYRNTYLSTDMFAQDVNEPATASVMSVQAVPVPEPSTEPLLVWAVALLVLMRKHSALSSFCLNK